MPDLIDTFKCVPLQSVQRRIKQLRACHKNIVCNYYLQDFEHHDIYASEAEKSMVFYYHDAHFKRVFFYSADMDELEEILGSIGGICVIDYITRDGEEQISSILSKCGYRKEACYIKVMNTDIREQMNKPGINKLRKFCEQEQIGFAAASDLNFLYESIYTQFNIYTDHLPSCEMLAQYIDKDHVLVNRRHDEIIGYIVFQVTGIWSHFNYYYGSFTDNPVHSIALLMAYYDLLIENSVSSVFGWVRQENSEMLSIHSRFNYIKSEIKDFIYLRDR